jgi:hypothetical protein
LAAFFARLSWLETVFFKSISDEVVDALLTFIMVENRREHGELGRGGVNYRRRLFCDPLACILGASTLRAAIAST